MSLYDLLCDSFHSCWTFPLINLIVLLVLNWLFYNSKNFKLNRFANLFKRRKRFLNFLRALIRAPYLAQWLNLLLAILFFKTFSLAAKTSLLALPSSIAITSPSYHILLFPLLLSLRRLFLLCLPWPNTQKITSSRFLGSFWILDLLLLLWLPYQLFSNTKAFVRGLWRLGSQMYIGLKLTWSTITSSSNVKTIWPLPRPRIKIECYLPTPSSKISPCFASSNTSGM